MVSRRGVVGDQEKGTSASNFYIFQNKHHRCFFSHRKWQHTKGNMAGNTTWHRHAWVVGSNDQTTAMQEEWCLHGNQFSLLLNSELVFCGIGLEMVRRFPGCATRPLS